MTLTNSFPPDLPPSAQTQTPPVSLLPEAEASEPPKEKKLKDYALTYREKIVTEMARILENGTDTNKIRAAEFLAGYTDGKPKQEVENTHVISYLDVLKQIKVNEQKFQAITTDAPPPMVVDVEVLPPPPPRKSRLADFV